MPQPDSWQFWVKMPHSDSHFKIWVFQFYRNVGPQINSLTFEHVDGDNNYGLCPEDICDSQEEGLRKWEKWNAFQEQVASEFTQRVLKDGANSEFSGIHWRPRTGHFTTYTVLSFEAS